MSGARPQVPQISNQDRKVFNISYQAALLGLMVSIFVLVGMVALVLYQIHHRPLPYFTATAVDGKKMHLTSFDEPNLLPDTLLTWASKAAVAAYTFDFVNYDKQAALARPYFTDAGWVDYKNSIQGLIATIKQNQLFVNGVVAGAPVISNQGEIAGRGHLWRIQMPFLVTYQSSEKTSRQSFTVMITIVKVPTQIDPSGIGIDQFIMI